MLLLAALPSPPTGTPALTRSHDGLARTLPPSAPLPAPHAQDDAALLAVVQRVWATHGTEMSIIRAVCTYLDRLAGTGAGGGGLQGGGMGSLKPLW